MSNKKETSETNEVVDVDKLKDSIRAELEQEYAQKIKALESKSSDSKTVSIPGEIALSLEDAETGKQKKVKVSIADGFPTCRPIRGQNVVVKTVDLMKIASGKKLDDSAQKAFDQLGFGKDKAIAYLEKLAISGSAMVEIKE